MRPFLLVSPDPHRLGVSPRYAPALDDPLKRDASSKADMTVSAVMIPTSGAVKNNWAVGSALAIAASRVQNLDLITDGRSGVH
jgi:hypothetical protein